MIPQTHITIDGDTALWVWRANEAFDGETGEDYLSPLNRPCDTCGGSGTHTVVHGQDAIDHYDTTDIACPDCDGTGRHTFDIEMAPAPICDGHSYYNQEPCYDCDRDAEAEASTFRVHVIDVLPIEQIVLAGEHQFVVDDNSDDNGLTGPLPPAAEVGQWLVRLAVHS